MTSSSAESSQGLTSLDDVLREHGYTREQLNAMPDPADDETAASRPPLPPPNPLLGQTVDDEPAVPLVSAAPKAHHTGMFSITTGPWGRECACECGLCWRNHKCVCVECTDPGHDHSERGTVPVVNA